MNREKAIDLLDNLIGMVEDNQESDYDTALKMGIQALSQEPIKYWIDHNGHVIPIQQPCDTENCKIVKALIGDPCKVKEPCDDAISREMALKECHDIVVDGERYRVIQEETLLGLPPVMQKSGKWIPLPDNATNGEVLKIMFKPNRITRTDDNTVHMEYDFTPDWWNAPYQKGGKE